MKNTNISGLYLPHHSAAVAVDIMNTINQQNNNSNLSSNFTSEKLEKALECLLKSENPELANYIKSGVSK